MDVPNKEEWIEQFQNIFYELEMKKLPESSFSAFRNENPLKYFRKGEAMYKCSRCKRTWTSLNGLINFTYRLTINEQTRVATGVVGLTAFGQQCKNCSGGPYIAARFTGEAIYIALEALVLKAKEKFYGENVTRALRNLSSKYTGFGSGIHDTDKCQACQLGVCQHGDMNIKYGGNTTRSQKNYLGPEPKSSHIKWVLKFEEDMQYKNQNCKETDQAHRQTKFPQTLSQTSTARSLTTVADFLVKKSSLTSSSTAWRLPTCSVPLKSLRTTCRATPSSTLTKTHPKYSSLNICNTNSCCSITKTSKTTTLPTYNSVVLKINDVNLKSRPNKIIIEPQQPQPTQKLPSSNQTESLSNSTSTFRKQGVRNRSSSSVSNTKPSGDTTSHSSPPDLHQQQSRLHHTRNTNKEIPPYLFIFCVFVLSMLRYVIETYLPTRNKTH